MTPQPNTWRTAAERGFAVSGMSANALEATVFRREFTAWVADALWHATTEERCGDIVLAAYEAAANTVDHAHPDGGPDAVVTVEARYRSDTQTLDVIVTDDGIWKPAQPEHCRGRGLALIGALADDATVSTGPTGTAVALQWHLR